MEDTSNANVKPDVPLINQASAAPGDGTNDRTFELEDNRVGSHKSDITGQAVEDMIPGSSSNKINPSPTSITSNLKPDVPFLNDENPKNEYNVTDVEGGEKKSEQEETKVKRRKSVFDNMKGGLSSSMLMRKDAPVKEDVTKAETPGFRNQEIEEQEPYYYQHMYHIKNLRKIPGLSEFPSQKIEVKDDKDMINAQMMPHACHGHLFTILFNYERAHVKGQNKSDFEGRTLLRILKHPFGTDLTEEQKRPEVKFERWLQNLNCGEKDVKNAFPGILNGHKLYFSVIKSDKETKTARYEIQSYDFETMEDRVVVSKELPFPKAYDDSDLIPQMGLLSVYVPINENAKFDKSIVLNEEQFLQNTHARYNYRSPEKLKDSGKFRGLLQAFRLSEFDKMLYDVRWNENTDKIERETPLKEFVQFGKYYLCSFADNKLEAEYMDIIPDGDSIKLSKKQGASMIDEDTKTRMERYFQPNFSIHSLIMNQETKQVEILDWKITDGKQIDEYRKLAEDCAFELCKEIKDDDDKVIRTIDTMNVMYCTISHQAYIMAGSGSYFEMKIIKLGSDFLKWKTIGAEGDALYPDLNKPKEPKSEKDKTSEGKDSIVNEAFKLEIKASQTNGIFMQIMTLNDEIVMRETISTDFQYQRLKMTSLCWSSQAQDKEDQPGRRKQKFLCSQFDEKRQYGQISEFRLVWNPQYFTEGKRIFEETGITSREVVDFMGYAGGIMTIQLISMHVIVLRDPIPQQINFLKSTVDEDSGKINGGEWWSSESNDRIEIKMTDIIDNNMNLKSDLTESIYKIYKNEKGEQVAFHAQATISKRMRELMKSPWQRALHMFLSFYDSNPVFSKAMDSQSYYGVTLSTLMQMTRKRTDCTSLSNNDRQRLLKQQIRIVLNMLPLQMNELILDEEDIDIFNPIEQLNGQCLCDFYLVKSEHVAKRIKIQKSQETRKSLIEVFLQSQENDDLNKLIGDQGYLQSPNELISGYYGGNPLQRCFQGSEVRTTTAQLLLDHIFQGEITFEERNILAVTMPYVLECDLKPFPFKKFGEFFKNKANNGLSFFQHVTDKSVDGFSNVHQTLTMAEQRNNSCDGTLAFKNHLACFQLRWASKAVADDLKTIPVQHCIIDYHQMSLFYIMKQFRAKKPINKTYIPTISDHLQMISEKFADQIEDHPCLMKINDVLFERTFIFFNVLLFLWCFGFIVPLVVQIVYSGEETAHVTDGCLTCCLIVVLIFHTIEFIIMSQQNIQEYFMDWSNYMDHIYFALFYYYFYHRVSHSTNDTILPLDHAMILNVNHVDRYRLVDGLPDETLPPLMDIIGFPTDILKVIQDSTLDGSIEYSLIHYTLILMSFKRALDIVKVQQSVGQTVKLVEAVLVDSVAFIIFFAMWVVVFSFLHRIVGNDVDPSDKRFPAVPEQVRYFLHTWISSTGGGATPRPDSSVWFKFENIDNEPVAYWERNFMVYFMWFIYILNQVFVNKILLSFLLAIVKKSFDKSMKGYVMNSYEAKSVMNQQCSIVYNAFGLIHESNLVVLTSNYRSPSKANVNAKLDKQMKKLDKEVNDIQQSIIKYADQQDEAAKHDKESMDDLKNMMRQLLNK